MSDKLRSCPFCGGDKIQMDCYIRDGREVICRECGASIHAYQPLANERSIAKWNKRTDPVKAQLIEALMAIRLQLLQSNNESDYAQEAIEKARAALAAAEADNGTH